MKEIKLVYARFENFKKLDRTIAFGNKKTWAFARNKVGKSSIADGIFWVLFGKSSTGKSEGKEFRPRPYGADGIDIDHIEVLAELTLLIDGTETVLRKVQQQKWTRKRGTTVDVHEGDTNIYSWNNVEISETEFKRRVSDIVSEKNFMLITDPTAFFRLSKSEKMDLILSLIANITEEQILVEVGGFDELFTFIREGKTLEEVRATCKRSISEMTKERDKISAFIAERSKDIVDVDVSDMELQRNAIKEKISEIELKIEDATATVTEYDEKSKYIIELKTNQSTIERTAEETLVKQKREIQKLIDAADDEFRGAVQQQKESELEMERLQRLIESNTSMREILIKRYEEVSKEEYPEYKEPEKLSKDDLVCPSCGQELPEDLKKQKITNCEEGLRLHREKYDKQVNDFVMDKKAALERITAEGSECADKIKKANSLLVLEREKVERAKQKKIDVNKENATATESLAKLPNRADLSDNQVYEKLCFEIQKSEEALRAMNTGAEYRSQLKSEKKEWEEQLSDVNRKFAAYDRSVEAKDRVTELEEQFKNMVQLIADQERILMMCEEFQTVKDNYLTDEVNKHFENIRFQLFRQQKNGGVERVCDVYTKNGSPYGDNTTSGAEKLIVGLEIINVLSGIIGVTAPVIVDNAEKVSNGNMPDMGSQMIMLSVSDDEDFRIEVED